jgi:hypothetical protein
MSDQKNNPPTFKDAENRVWTIKLTLSLLDQVLAATQVDLTPDDHDPSTITALLFETRKLGAVLWECCRAQASAAGVDQAAFKDAVDGEVLLKGWEALVDAIYFFIQNRNQKLAEAMREAIEAQLRVMETGAAAMAQTIKSNETTEGLRKAGERIATELQGEMTKALDSFATS